MRVSRVRGGGAGRASAPSTMAVGERALPGGGGRRPGLEGAPASHRRPVGSPRCGCGGGCRRLCRGPSGPGNVGLGGDKGRAPGGSGAGSARGRRGRGAREPAAVGTRAARAAAARRLRGWASALRPPHWLVWPAIGDLHRGAVARLVVPPGVGLLALGDEGARLQGLKLQFLLQQLLGVLRPLAVGRTCWHKEHERDLRADREAGAAGRGRDGAVAELSRRVSKARGRASRSHTAGATACRARREAVAPANRPRASVLGRPMAAPGPSQRRSR